MFILLSAYLLPLFNHKTYSEAIYLFFYSSLCNFVPKEVILILKSLSAATMQFSLLSLLASAVVVSAVPAPDQPYNENPLKRQIYTCEANAIYCNS